MAVMDEIERLAQDEMNNFRSPEVVYLGVNKYRQLINEMASRMRHSVSGPVLTHTPTIATVIACCGPLQVKVMCNPPDAIIIGENAILIVLQKLGLRW